MLRLAMTSCCLMPQLPAVSCLDQLRMWQARSAAEAMRGTLAHVEAALEGHEAELHDSWQALRQQAAELQSDVELTSEMLQPDVSARVSSPLPPPHAPLSPSYSLIPDHTPPPLPHRSSLAIGCELAEVQSNADLKPDILQPHIPSQAGLPAIQSTPPS